MYLFFDTETTGVPINYKGKVTDVDNWPRIIQLAFMVYDKDRNISHKYCELIKPDCWVIPTQKFWIDNGFDTVRSMNNGVSIYDALFELLCVTDDCEYLIAHNLAFDRPIVGAECIRASLSINKKLIPICTMEASTDFCQLANPNSALNFKWPKLEELHEKLFGVKFDGAHDALADVKATAKCFFELVDRKIITLN